MSWTRHGHAVNEGCHTAIVHRECSAESSKVGAAWQRLHAGLPRPHEGNQPAHLQQHTSGEEPRHWHCRQVLALRRQHARRCSLRCSAGRAAGQSIARTGRSSGLIAVTLSFVFSAVRSPLCASRVARGTTHTAARVLCLLLHCTESPLRRPDRSSPAASLRDRGSSPPCGARRRPATGHRRGLMARGVTAPLQEGERHCVRHHITPPRPLLPVAAACCARVQTVEVGKGVGSCCCLLLLLRLAAHGCRLQRSAKALLAQRIHIAPVQAK